MADFLQLIISGLATGAIYALVAIGFTLIWQTSQTINFAQGEFVMVPAFFVLGAAKIFAVPFPVALLIGFAVAILILGILFKQVVVDPMLQHGVLPLAIATMALSILLKDGTKEFYSAEGQSFPSLVGHEVVSVVGIAVPLSDLVVFGIAVGAVIGLQLFLSRTRLGRTMQATAQNRTVAMILGVPVERMVLLAFAINAILAALASFLVSPIYLAKFSNGEYLGLAAFMAAIIGGFNQVRGAIVGGLLLGIVDNLAAAYVSSSYRLALPMLILVLVILWRPQGLVGRAEERTV